jgi:hypothetical protein
MSTSRSQSSRLWWRLALLVVVLAGFQLVIVACNDYPIQRITAQTFVQINDSQPQLTTKAVDILFVVDNSGSMVQEQDKLARNFEAFIKLLRGQDINDFQIGIITTDADSSSGQGKLQGTPRIIQYPQMTQDDITKYFVQNIKVGIGGSPYEKGLESMRLALSPAMRSGYNKGFLRDDAVLAIIFIGDEDDCSHPNKLDEDKFSDICYIPKTAKTEFGDKGQMEDLHGVKRYIDFLKTLKKDSKNILVAGIIGDPAVKDPNKKDGSTIDPKGGCTSNGQCSVGTSSHYCGYASPTSRKCGGCISKVLVPDPSNPGKKIPEADAGPSFRFYEVIKSFGGANNWYSICGDDNGFRSALIDFAGLIINKLTFITLTRAPSTPNALEVTIVRTNAQGTQETKIEKAASTGKACSQDADCSKKGVCGPNANGNGQVCYGEGWVYYSPVNAGEKPRIKFSGEKTLQVITPGDKDSIKINVSYISQ